MPAFGKIVASSVGGAVVPRIGLPIGDLTVTLKADRGGTGVRLVHSERNRLFDRRACDINELEEDVVLVPTKEEVLLEGDPRSTRGREQRA